MTCVALPCSSPSAALNLVNVTNRAFNAHLVKTTNRVTGYVLGQNDQPDSQEELAMDYDTLFVRFLHLLKNYNDAAALWALAINQADQKEYRVSKESLVANYFEGRVTGLQVRRSIERLAARNLISMRVHANYRTYFKVNTEAVLALLREPLPKDLPGLGKPSTRKSSLLEAWQAELDQKTAGTPINYVQESSDGKHQEN